MLLLQEIPLGVLNSIYTAALWLSFPVLAGFAAWYAPRYNMSRKKGAVYSLCVYIVLFGLMYLLPGILKLFGISDSLNSSRCFLFVLLPAVLFARFTSVSTMQGSDFVIPALFAARAIGKVGCVFAGCCHGVPCEWGIYSAVAKTKVFPLQWLEVTFCIVMIVVCVWDAKRHQYQANGRVYGMAMTVFGIERYLIQFLTTDYQFGIGFNMQSIYAILMVLLGLLIFYFAENPIKIGKSKQ